MILKCIYYYLGIYDKRKEELNYEMDCTQHNGVYKKSYEEWKNKYL